MADAQFRGLSCKMGAAGCRSRPSPPTATRFVGSDACKAACNPDYRLTSARQQPAQPQQQRQQLQRRWQPPAVAWGAGRPLPAHFSHVPAAATDKTTTAASAGSDLPLEAAAAGGLQFGQTAAGGLETHLAALAAWLDAFYRFTRPHTMLGTAVSVCSVSALALGPGQLSRVAVQAALQALSSALLMNVCIVGINQLYDVEIDRINKPYLPLAAGDFSMGMARVIVLATGAASLAIGVASGSAPLLATLGGSLLLGIAYSTDLPLLRWKRSPVLAATCILAVRAVLVQLGFFFHMQLALGSGAPAITRPIAFATAFMLLFSVVIALFKDIPDIAGDKKAGVRTLSVRLGPSRVFWACIAILEAAYAGAIVVGLQAQHAWARAAITAAHVALGSLLLWRARQTDLSSPREISKAYMFSWGLFYAEYLLLPLFGM